MKVLDREGHGGKLILGDGVKIDDTVEFDTSCDIFVGDGAAISDGALILTHDHRPEDITQKVFCPKRIGKGAWICARAIVLASCEEIGGGAVVAAGAVVTHDVPPDTLVAGNPARIVRHLR